MALINCPECGSNVSKRAAACPACGYSEKSNEDHRLNIQLFNAHAEDTRSRANFLVKSIFLISGGALTVSIGLLVNDSAPALSSFASCWLVISWVGLISSIILGASSMLAMIGRDYALTEKWRYYLPSGIPREYAFRKWPDLVIWGLGLLSYVGFLLGMVGLATVVTTLI